MANYPMMRNKLSDAAALAARRKALLADIGGPDYPGPVAKPLSGRRVASAPAAAVPESGGAPAGKAPGKWRNALAAGLRGAGYGIMANVGAPVAGQEFAQGILKGISGLSTLAREREAREAAIEARQAERGGRLSDALALLGRKAELKPSIEQEAARAKAIAEARQGTALERIKESGKIQLGIREKIGDLEKNVKADDLPKIRNQAYQNVLGRIPKHKLDDITKDELDTMYQQEYLRLLPKEEPYNPPNLDD